jgi:hypothetical protein
MNSSTPKNPRKSMKFNLGRGCYFHPYKDENIPWDGAV